MENFLKIMDMILPVCIIICIGFLGRKIHIFTEGFLLKASSLVLIVFLPISLFLNMHQPEGMGLADEGFLSIL